MKALWLMASALASPAAGLVIAGDILQETCAGRFVLLDPNDGFTVGKDNFNTCHLYAFDEDQNIVLPEPIHVDSGGLNGLIAQGTEVASHCMFFDSINDTQFAFVEFDAPILGIAAYQDTMGATDFLARTKATFIGERLRGLEENDEVWIDPDRPDRLYVLWAGSSPGDYIRVFTERSVGAALV
ncbi:hypothetical protein [Octadecabacter ascidiaceicola]|uniref:Uncharacterized protein n=1 Tax=Octadecabacter ascidiaceicola TaxID=1655543 RepID=A0A238JT79_9RHOB|nr:hypothetical protein [Octadecabacter ascidiaceicola]SMX33387.1 hypothetical protein OCA8868_00943 [Octadecabacter ascidiaceicola]